MRAGHVERESRASSLLSPYEHSTLISLLGAKCQSLSTSVIQLFLTDGPDHSQWRRKDAGVLCFVKDHIRRSYFFRLYCLTRRSLVWEQQVYNNMKYMAPRTWLHTFEAEYAMAAFNFANDDEAESFQRVVLDQLEQKRIRRIERRSRASLGDTVQGSMPNLAGAGPPAGLINGPSGKHHRSASSGATGASKKKDKETLRRRIKKEEIGLPKDFRHVSHVGWDPNKGFDVDLDRIEDTNLKKFFEKAGVSESQLKDRDTREFIYEFIQRNGGLDAVKEDVVPPSRAPPVPSRVPPHKPSPPPPPPTLAQPSRACPPTPVSQQRSAPPPPPPPSAKPSMNQSSPAPPPPPPPPMADLAPPPPPLAPPMMAPAAVAPAVPDTRSALLAAIKSGTTLKHVEVEKKVLPDSRGDLLDQIRQGVELKTVQPNERPSGPSKPTEGLAAALAKALEQRNNAFRYSDSEPDSDSGDSEWEE